MGRGGQDGGREREKEGGVGRKGLREGGEGGIEGGARG